MSVTFLLIVTCFTDQIIANRINNIKTKDDALEEATKLVEKAEETKDTEDIKKALEAIGVRGELPEDTSFEKMGIDSIVFVKLIVELEKLLDIQFPEDYLSISIVKSVSNLKQIINSIEKNCNNKYIEQERNTIYGK